MNTLVSDAPTPSARAASIADHVEGKIDPPRRVELHEAEEQERILLEVIGEMLRAIVAMRTNSMLSGSSGFAFRGFEHASL